MDVTSFKDLSKTSGADLRPWRLRPWLEETGGRVTAAHTRRGRADLAQFQRRFSPPF